MFGKHWEYRRKYDGKQFTEYEKGGTINNNIFIGGIYVKMRKRLFALLACIAMIMAILPAAYADEPAAGSYVINSLEGYMMEDGGIEARANITGSGDVNIIIASYRGDALEDMHSE